MLRNTQEGLSVLVRLSLITSMTSYDVVSCVACMMMLLLAVLYCITILAVSLYYFSEILVEALFLLLLLVHFLWGCCVGPNNNINDPLISMIVKYTTNYCWVSIKCADNRSGGGQKTFRKETERDRLRKWGREREGLRRLMGWERRWCVQTTFKMWGDNGSAQTTEVSAKFKSAV